MIDVEFACDALGGTMRPLPPARRFIASKIHKVRGKAIRIDKKVYSAVAVRQTKQSRDP
jgi:hypothetical protein